MTFFVGVCTKIFLCSMKAINETAAFELYLATVLKPAIRSFIYFCSKLILKFWRLADYFQTNRFNGCNGLTFIVRFYLLGRNISKFQRELPALVIYWTLYLCTERPSYAPPPPPAPTTVSGQVLQTVSLAATTQSKLSLLPCFLLRV